MGKGWVGVEVEYQKTSEELLGDKRMGWGSSSTGGCGGMVNYDVRRT